MSPRRLVGIALALAASAAHAQTMLDQEERLIELHALLAGLPPLQAPGAYALGQASLGLELVTIPIIDGQTGGKLQITASDRTRAFPRLRLAAGLPAPEGFRAFVGVAYIPPVELEGVSSNLGAVEAGIAWTPGPLAVGLRGHGLLARSMSPVTDPATRDRLDSSELGADLAVGWSLDLGWGQLTPFVGAGVDRVHGRFTVTSDGHVLTLTATDQALSAGVRLLSTHHVEGVVELVAFPGRLVHPAFRLAWVPGPSRAVGQ
jgi:hypothetical protein